MASYSKIFRPLFLTLLYITGAISVFGYEQGSYYIFDLTDGDETEVIEGRIGASKDVFSKAEADSSSSFNTESSFNLTESAFVGE